MTKKKTMYEILEVSPTASYAEIKAAHKRLSIALMSGTLGLTREEIDFKLNVLDVALHTLSVPVSRDAYDVLLESSTAPHNIILPIKGNVVSLGDDAKARKIVAAIEDNRKLAEAIADRSLFPMEVVSSTVSISARSFKKILRVVITLLVLASVFKIGQSAFAFHPSAAPSAEVAKAEEKLIIQEYYQKHGVRPASRAEAELLEQENRRKENEQREAAFAEERRDEEYRRFVEESQRIGDKVSSNLAREEEHAQREEMRRQSELAEEKRMQEEAVQEAERTRIENERRRWGLN